MHKYSEWFLRAGPKLRTKNKNNNNGTCLSSNPGNVPWKLQNDSVAWAWGHPYQRTMRVRVTRALIMCIIIIIPCAMNVSVGGKRRTREDYKLMEPTMTRVLNRHDRPLTRSGIRPITFFRDSFSNSNGLDTTQSSFVCVLLHSVGGSGNRFWIFMIALVNACHIIHVHILVSSSFLPPFLRSIRSDPGWWVVR